ncbi:MAG TPA: DUF6046 domain-containing protein [Phnomibacter sp.]|nr:DUF6046 domain-containing protein [Phnomibacter sp.]
MALITYDIQELYRRTFGTNPIVPSMPKASPIAELPVVSSAQQPGIYTARGRQLMEQYRGVEVWMPVRLWGVMGTSPALLELPYSVVRAQNKKHIISTPLAGRQGTVKELYSADDWQITIRGFLIGTNNSWPEDEVERLAQFFRLQQPLVIASPLTDVLLEDKQRPHEQCRAVIEALEFTEVEGGRLKAQGFALKLLSDSIFTLELS